MKPNRLNMTAIDETEKITVELTKEQKAFLDWAAKLEGVTPQDYLLRAVKGRLVKLAPDDN
jgi:uncharacterized protein (DUF1778 family)